jgi:peptidoglycan-N-acetylglucosamine deacetylase
MPDEILVSFVVIAYNEEANIARTINSITGLADLGRYEVIVVDDGSRDGTARIVGGLADQNPHIRLSSDWPRIAAGAAPGAPG